MGLLVYYILIEGIVTYFLRKHLKGKLCLIPLLIAAGTAAYQMYQANQQKKLAKELKPSNYIPPGLKEAEMSTRINANSMGPGYTRGLERIKSTTANTIEASKRVGGTPAQLQQTVADADAREKNLMKDLEVNQEAFRVGQQDKLTNILMRKAGYQKDSKDAYDAAVSSLKGAAMQNNYNAVTGFAENSIQLLPDSAFPNGRPGAIPPTTPAATQPPTGRKPMAGKWASYRGAGLNRIPWAVRDQMKYDPYDTTNFNFDQQSAF